VVHEIRDQATRDWLQTLPYVLKLREPTPEAIKIGSLIESLLYFVCSFEATVVRSNEGKYCIKAGVIHTVNHTNSTGLICNGSFPHHL